MNRLEQKLRRLKHNQGDSDLVKELEALASNIKKTTPTSPLSCKLLAQAANQIREQQLSIAHESLGASIEAYRKEQNNEEVKLGPAVTAQLLTLAEAANPNAFQIPLPDFNDAPTFLVAPEEMISGFANLLLTAGYTDEARAYLSGYNLLQEQGECEDMKNNLDSLHQLRAGFKKDGNLSMVRSIDEILAELPEEEGTPAPEAGPSRGGVMEEEATGMEDGEPKEQAMQAAYMMKAAEELRNDSGADQDEADDMAKAAEELYEQATSCTEKEDDMAKPVLDVQAASRAELQYREIAKKAALAGNLQDAKKCLALAKKLEKSRIIAALITAGDTELAMEGLEENEEDEGMGGYAETESYDDSEDTLEGNDEGMDDIIDETEDEGMDYEEQFSEDEATESEKLQAHAMKNLRRKNVKAAVFALTKLNQLENAIVAGVKTAEQVNRNKVLAKEGYNLWQIVRKNRLATEMAIANEEGDEEAYDEAMQKMEDHVDSYDDEGMDDSLEEMPAEGEELSDTAITPPGGVSETEPGTDNPRPKASKQGNPGYHEDEDESEEHEAGESEEHEASEEEHEEEAEAMHYEVLQSIDEVKALVVTRAALAFTFWENQNDPYYVIQAAGRPLAEVHLRDQNDAEDVKAFFCDEQKWPNVIAQTVEKVGLYEMLKGVKARFYAVQANKGKLAAELKQEAVASLKHERNDRLTSLRNDFIEAVTVAANALNKGIIAGKANPLKGAMVKHLTSLGISNPAVIVESAFADAFLPTFEQILADANEYLEMPRESFEYTKRMVNQATNIAKAQVSQYSEGTLSQRLSQNSFPLNHMNNASEAPNAEVQAAVGRMSERERRTGLKDRLGLSKKF